MSSAPHHHSEGGVPANSATLKVDDAKAQACYANFCRVIGTPEEIVIDFGLNTQTNPTEEQPVAVSQRLVINYYTAKRLLQALTATVGRYENSFGTLETNVGKRLEKKG
ncbi:MAG: DUF3467 domain-containing protein [Planctomycetales bacterium]|nr:DUF3467 domain-containing protein [Planctomycetales bacterium]